MGLISVTRRYGFPAAHVLRHPSFSDEQNQRIYGKCANPNGHGHHYGLEVTVEGPVDEASGEIIAPAELDRIVEERVLRRFGYGLLNEDELFRQRVPTAENIVAAAHEQLAAAVGGAGGRRLRAVRLIETRRNHFEYRGDR